MLDVGRKLRDECIYHTNIKNIYMYVTSLSHYKSFIKTIKSSMPSSYVQCYIKLLWHVACSLNTLSFWHRQKKKVYICYKVFLSRTYQWSNYNSSSYIFILRLSYVHLNQSIYEICHYIRYGLCHLVIAIFAVSIGALIHITLVYWLHSSHSPFGYLTSCPRSRSTKTLPYASGI